MLSHTKSQKPLVFFSHDYITNLCVIAHLPPTDCSARLTSPLVSKLMTYTTLPSLGSHYLRNPSFSLSSKFNSSSYKYFIISSILKNYFWPCDPLQLSSCFFPSLYYPNSLKTKLHPHYFCVLITEHALLLLLPPTHMYLPSPNISQYPPNISHNFCSNQYSVLAVLLLSKKHIQLDHME